MSDPKQRLDHGSKFPYDAGSNFWEGDGNSTPPQALDWAHAAARGILADLLDRRGVKYALEEVDHDVRVEMVESLANIIREAAP